MKRLALVVLLALVPGFSHAADYDLSFPSGLSVKLLGASNQVIGGWPESYAMVAFNEPIGEPWAASCVNQRFYINLTNRGGRALYTTLMMSQISGKKVTRMMGDTADPSLVNVCTATWVQVE